MSKEHYQENKGREFCFLSTVTSTYIQLLACDYRQNGMAVREGRKKWMHSETVTIEEQWSTFLLLTWSILPLSWKKKVLFVCSLYF